MTFHVEFWGCRLLPWAIPAAASLYKHSWLPDPFPSHPPTPTHPPACLQMIRWDAIAFWTTSAHWFRAFLKSTVQVMKNKTDLSVKHLNTDNKATKSASWLRSYTSYIAIYGYTNQWSEICYLKFCLKEACLRPVVKKLGGRWEQGIS